MTLLFSSELSLGHYWSFEEGNRFRSSVQKANGWKDGTHSQNRSNMHGTQSSFLELGLATVHT